MSSANETADDPLPPLRSRAAVPGMLLVWSNDAPTCRAFPFTRHKLEVGREAQCEIPLVKDDSCSRVHAKVWLEGDDLHVHDLDSRNGTFVNGVRIEGTHTMTVSSRAVVRFGQSAFLVEPDLGRVDARTDLNEGNWILGAAMKRVWRLTADAAGHDRSLLIHGETGTGKERVAKIFHEHGPRVRGPYVVVNCASVNPDRAESDLFGHVRGAFTGADRDQTGSFDEANGGVLFFDEIAELAPKVQAKLLRALQEREIVPMGGNKPKRVDLGLCFATHRDLRALVAAGEFREDFYHRLVQREVELPPLRERPEEIGFLVEKFRARVRLAPPASGRFVEWCLLQRWTGNVREIQSVAERAAASAAADGLARIDAALDPPSTELRSPLQSAPPEAPPPGTKAPSTPRELKDALIMATLKEHHGDVRATAEHLGVHRSTIYDCIERQRRKG